MYMYVPRELYFLRFTHSWSTPRNLRTGRLGAHRAKGFIYKQNSNKYFLTTKKKKRLHSPSKVDLSSFCHHSTPVHPSPNNRPCVFPLGSHHFSPTWSMSCLRWNWICSSFLPRRVSTGLGSGPSVNQKPQPEHFIHGCTIIQSESTMRKERWTWKDRDLMLLGTILPVP